MFKDKIQEAIKGMFLISESESELKLQKAELLTLSQFRDKLIKSGQYSDQWNNLFCSLIHLAELRIFRIGEIEVRILITGRDQFGELICIEMLSIET